MYILRGDDHICDIMYYAYSWPLYSYVSGIALCTCRVVLLYYADWVAGFPFGILLHSTSGMDL